MVPYSILPPIPTKNESESNGMILQEEDIMEQLKEWSTLMQAVKRAVVY